MLQKHRGDVPLVIVRPAIIGSALQDPVPGWIDSINAAGAIYLAAGMGILQFLPGDISLIGDQIPVDYTSNCIIVATALRANQNKLSVYHSASSSVNPLTWAMVR